MTNKLDARLIVALGLSLVGACAEQDNQSQTPALASLTGETSAALRTEADFKDPGTAPWVQGTEAECGLDFGLLAAADIPNFAVFRRGKLCYIKGLNDVAAMFSATKTLGGLMVGRAAYLTRKLPRTLPRTGTISPEDKASYWLGSVDYNKDAKLTHVMSMTGHNTNNLALYDPTVWTYDTVGSVQINTLIKVTEKCIAQLPWLPSDAPTFVQEQLFDKLGMSKSYWSDWPLGIASGWHSDMLEMGRLGMLLLHDGWYNGERLVAREWVYKMSHPAFEAANTAYGHLTWLNHRGHGYGIGNPVTGSTRVLPIDMCAPAAVWPSYRHGISQSDNCNPTTPLSTCAQPNDVGVYSAQGTGGQLIVMHPGLDLVLVAHDWVGEDLAMKFWERVRPALLAKDPVYAGRPQAFCDDYGAGKYAPDLVLPRQLTGAL